VTGLRFDRTWSPTITSPAWLAGGSSTSRVAIVPGADGRRMLPSWLHYYNCHRTHRSLGGACRPDTIWSEPTARQTERDCDQTKHDRLDGVRKEHFNTALRWSRARRYAASGRIACLSRVALLRGSPGA
jgi:hypothetical protein